MNLIKRIIREIKYTFVKPQVTQIVTLGRNSFGNVSFEGESIESTDEREKKSPIHVIHELEAGIKLKPLELDKLIKELKIRKKHVERVLKLSTGNEERAIDMLKARKKYPKYNDLFEWKTTVQSKIDMLVKRYMLKHDDLSRFIDEVPEIAIQEMVKFSEAMAKVTKKEPEFSIIGPDEMFEDDDPILLAKSPFGNYYYILCAWDKEVKIVEQLLEGEKMVIDDKND